MTSVASRIAASSIGVTNIRWLRWMWRFLAIGMGAVHTWAAATSHSMNADGVSYLDMGDAFLRGDWEVAFSSPWSPMYAWVQGFVLSVVDPPMRWEFPTVHLVNFTIFLFALVCFEYFWKELVRYHAAQIVGWQTPENHTGWPIWALWSIGYLLFFFGGLVLIELWSVEPDMLMSAFVYLGSGLVIRMRLGDRRWRVFILFGIILGLGYLAKEIMLPVGILLLGAALLSSGELRAAAPRILVSATLFVLTLLPYSVLQNQSRGESTFGGAALFTYAKHVNRIPFAHWQGETPGNGTPLHPTRKILTDPPVYEFATPIGGTYPVSYNPAYWNAGLKARFDLRQQAEALLTSSLFYYDLFVGQLGALLFGVLTVYLVRGRTVWRRVARLSNWGLTLTALAVFIFYGIVLVTGRYIGAFVVIFFADLLAYVSLPDTAFSRRLLRVIGAIVITFLLLSLVAANLSGYQDLSGTGTGPTSDAPASRAPSWPGEVAGELQRLGIQKQTRVGVIGYGFDSFWARLARVRIVAELPDLYAEPFWVGDEAYQGRVINAFATAGVEAIVAESVPGYAKLPGWQQVADTNYYVYLLTR